jgi:RNA polymerase sigma factor (sigma-70 family)
MTLGEQLDQARDGDQLAWDALVERFSGLLWATARAHRMTSAQAADVIQNTWLRLVENLDRIEDPERLGAWLATTARRECLRTIRLGAREVVTDEEWMWEVPGEDEVDSGLIVRERDAALWRAFRAIGERCQALLRMLAAPDPPSYEEIGAALEMPIGSIGPTRTRCLDKLRRSLALEGADLR